MSNYDILILSMASDKAFENEMDGTPVPVALPIEGWWRVWRNINELLDLEAPMHRFPQSLPIRVEDFDEDPF